MTTSPRTISYAARSTVAVAGLLLVAGCGGNGGTDATVAGGTVELVLSRRTLTVFAAASLQKSFEQIG